MVGALVIVFYSLVETGYIAVYKLAGLADAFKISDMFTINCVHGDLYASVVSFAGKISKFISGIFRVDLCEVFLRMFFKISFNSTSINPKIFSNLGDGHVFSELYHFRNVRVFDFCIAIAKTSVALLVFLNSMFRHFKPKHAPGFSTGIVFGIQGVNIKLLSRNKQFRISNAFNDFKLKCVKTVLIKSSLKCNTVMLILSQIKNMLFPSGLVIDGRSYIAVSTFSVFNLINSMHVFGIKKYRKNILYIKKDDAGMLIWGMK